MDCTVQWWFASLGCFQSSVFGFAAFPSAFKRRLCLCSCFLDSHPLMSPFFFFSFFFLLHLPSLPYFTLSPFSYTGHSSSSCCFLSGLTLLCFLFTLFCCKINFSLFFPSLSALLWLLMCFLSLCACRPSAVPPALLLQLSVSPSAYDSQASDELSSNQSMNFSPSNSAQPIPCLDSGPSTAHSSSGAARQVSVEG